MENKGGNKQDQNELISGAIQEGLTSLIKNNPKFGQDYIQRHIDGDAVNGYLKDLSKELKESNLPEEEKLKYLHDGLADYVASGGALDKNGKKTVLIKGSLEERARSLNPLKIFQKLSARKTLRGEEKFDNTIEAFKDLYSLFKTGEYAQSMPQLALAVQTVYNAGFFDASIDVLKSRGLIDGNKYNLLKKALRQKVEDSSKFTISNIEKYIAGGKQDYSYSQAAAIIVGITGMLIVFTSANMTGGVIGALGSNNIKIIGGFLFLSSIILFLKAIRKKGRLKTFKNR